MPNAITEKLADIYDRLVEIRHELHACPELAYQERQTSQRLATWLGDIPTLSVRTGLGGGTGILATLSTGRPGPVVALRADIDALPITESSNLPYVSKSPGLMHACGHDGHATCLLGSAMVLSSIREQLCGSIKFIFQPAEENGGGGRVMVADGVLDDPPVQAIFGLHGWPALKVGVAATRPGPLMASTDNFHITLHGKGTHGAHPHLGVDPIVAAAHVVVALQSIVARTLDPLKSGVVTVGRFHAGTTTNIIPVTAELAGTMRSLDAEVRDHLRNQVEQVARHTAAAHGCRAEVELKAGYPVVVNDARMARLVAETAVDVLGPGNFDPDRPPSMGGEDFAYYLQKAPGCYFFIGTCPRDRADCPSLHTPTYDFSDEAIGIGVRMLCELAVRCSNGALAVLSG